jgi:methyl-accepting chemotaxis protein PixJ
MVANGYSSDLSSLPSNAWSNPDLAEEVAPVSAVANKTSEDKSPDNHSNPSPKAPQPTPSSSRQAKMGSIGSRFNLRFKATVAAIAIGTLPVATIGGTAYWASSNTLRTKVANNYIADAGDMADKINRFMFERYGDVQVVASRSFLVSPKVRELVTAAEKSESLTRYAEIYQVYDSIAAFDLNGDVIAQSKGTPLGNHKDRIYFQQVVRTGKPVISQPSISKSSGKMAIHFAAPIYDNVTKKMIGVVRTRMPIQYLDAVVQRFGNGTDTYVIADNRGDVFAAENPEALSKKFWQAIPGTEQWRDTIGVEGTLTTDATAGSLLVGHGSTKPLAGLPDLEWHTMRTVPTDDAFAAETQLRTTLMAGTAIAALVVAAIAAWLASRAVKPIQDASKAVEKIGDGDLTVRLPVIGKDEVALLSSNINQMTAQIEGLIDEQKAEADRIERARQEARADADMATEEQRQQKEFLRKRALELLIEVDPVGKGDLTVRASVTADEVGTIADSYNALIRSLRRIVEQVQTAAAAVTHTTSTNEASVSELSQEAQAQMLAIATAADKVQAMVTSIQGVAERAQQAELGVQQATRTIQAGDDAMNRTVEGFSTIRETVAETAKKVKRLGEASQKISKVVNLIGGFASQTNLLALNAAIEAARAGEEGRGFAVVAEEVRSLAQQSASATAEIEQLVEEIQTQTNDVVTAMETGTQQVVTGTQLVQETRQRLNQITQVSEHINQLVQEISAAAAAQTEASTVVTTTIQEVAEIADDTSKRSETVASSFSDLLNVAQELQVSIAQFKL